MMIYNNLVSLRWKKEKQELCMCDKTMYYNEKRTQVTYKTEKN